MTDIKCKDSIKANKIVEIISNNNLLDLLIFRNCILYPIQLNKFK